jgi:hypothetical protein
MIINDNTGSRIHMRYTENHGNDPKCRISEYFDSIFVFILFFFIFFHFLKN